MVQTTQIKITLSQEDAERFQQLSDNTGLAKSTLVKLMLNGSLRDMKKQPYAGDSSRLILAWCGKHEKAVLENIEVW